MSELNATKSGSRDWALVLPTVLVLFVFGLIVGMRGLPYSAQLTQAREAHRVALAGEVQPEQVRKFDQRKKAVEAELAAAKGSLAKEQRNAQLVAGSKIDPVANVDLLSDVHTCFKRHGMVVAVDRSLQRGDDVALAASLRSSLSSLLTALEASKATTGGKANPARVNPVMLEPEAYQDFVQQQQQQLTDGWEGTATPMGNRVAAPPLHLRELLVVGSYMDMLEGLNTLSRESRQTMIVSVRLERPLEARRLLRNNQLLGWRLVVHVQPDPFPKPPAPSEDKVVSAKN